MRAIYFDMDGTIADLYGYENWLPMLQAEDTTPYEKASPCVNVEELTEVLNEFIAAGITIGVISWGAMDGSREYCKRTRKAKKAWCDYYFPNVFTEFHVVKYGTPKHHVRKEKDSILVDDNADVRNAWKGETVDATQDIIALLKTILENEKEKNRYRIFSDSSNKWEKAEKEGLFSPMFDEHKKGTNGLYLLGQVTLNPVTKEERYWIKVGLTTNGYTRLSSYLTHSADIYFIDWCPMDRNKLSNNECACHVQLGEIALTNRTEWFKVSKKFYFDICEKGFSKFKMRI